MTMKKRKYLSLSGYLINAAMIVALYLVVNYMITGGIIPRAYRGFILNAGIYVVAAVSLNLTCGFLGQLPLGHAGFMAVGAYITAIFTKMVHMENTTLAFAISILIAGIAAAIVGIIVGLPALRLHGDYLAIITLAAGEMIRVILQNIYIDNPDKVNSFIVAGPAGIQHIPRETNFTWVYWISVFTIFVIFTLTRSKGGRAIMSIRENEIAAESCGINTTYFKTLAFALAAFFAGVAGSLYAGYVGQIEPASFDFNRSIEILVMVVLGGMGSIIGSVLAAVVLTILPEVLRGFSDYRLVVYSLLLVVVMIFKPTGLLGGYEFSLSGILKKIFRKKQKAEEGK